MNSLTFNKKKYLSVFSLIIFFLMNSFSFAQEIETKRTSIRTGVGMGVNTGKREMGMGLLYSIGWQKSYGKKNKLRLNPNIVFGGFSPFIITDLGYQFYRITSLGLNIHYDLITYQGASLVVTAGGFVNYSRGLSETGGRGYAPHSLESFNTLYSGGNISFGIRCDDPKNKKIEYEFRPINIQLGNNYFALIYTMFGVNFK